MFKKIYSGLLLATFIVIFSCIIVSASEEWKSKYRDIEPIRDTGYFLIHLYDVQTEVGAAYATGVADKNGNVTLPVIYMYVDVDNYSDGRMLIQTFGNKHGFVDENFNIVIEPVYDRAWPFENGAAKVQTASPNGTGKVLYIDKNGGIIPDPAPEAEKDFSYYADLIRLELKLDLNEQIGSSDYAVCFRYSEGALKYGIIDVKTREYFSPLKWDEIRPDKSGKIWGQMKNTEGAYDTYVIHEDGTEEFKFKSEYIVGVWQNGLITFLVDEPVKQADYAYSPDTLFDGSILKSGLMDSEGNIIIEPVWETPNPGVWLDDYPASRDGYLIGMKGSKNYSYVKGIGTVGDGKFGCVTTEGNLVIEPLYDSIVYEGNGAFAVTLGGETKTINLKSEPLSNKTAKAQATASEMYVNGRKIDFEAYLIDGYNYFKLRDIACALNGTEKQFEVGYDNDLKAISLTTGRIYTVTGAELTKGDGKVKAAELNPAAIYLNGTEVSLAAYNIDGYNYFRLRDLAELLDFAVEYDAVKKSVSIKS